jgi:hypothetical protein
MVVKDGDPKALVIRTASGAQDRVRIVIELSNLAVLVTELLKRARRFARTEEPTSAGTI